MADASDGAGIDTAPITKKARSRDLALQFVVRLAGIEPTTPWFVAKYSIQLSYSRPSTHYSGAASKREVSG